MIFLNRKPGEALVVETPNGKVVVQVLGDNRFGIDLPTGARVAATARPEAPGQWLPARPTRRAS